jgi:hypothetical protein
MLSIQEITYYIKLSEQRLVSPIQCPFNEENVLEHMLLPKVDENGKVFFKCLSCNTNFEPGLNAEKIIKKSIEKYNKTQ